MTLIFSCSEANKIAKNQPPQAHTPAHLDGELDEQNPQTETREQLHFEHLVFGAHISAHALRPDSCNMPVLMWRDKFGADAVPLIGLQHKDFQRDYSISIALPLEEGDILLSQSNLCALVVNMLGGFHNDLFELVDCRDIESFPSQLSSDRGILIDFFSQAAPRWVKIGTCSRVTVPGMTRPTCQNVLNWFVSFSNDLSRCRTMCDVVLQHCAASAAGAVGRHAEAGGVSLHLQPLFTSIQSSLAQLDEALADLELKASRGASEASLLALHLLMKPFQTLFSSLREMVDNVCLLMKDSSALSGRLGVEPLSSAAEDSGSSRLGN